MKLSRRKFLRLAAGAAALPAITRVASAETYPARFTGSYSCRALSNASLLCGSVPPRRMV
jgi:hypothetical protein